MSRRVTRWRYVFITGAVARNAGHLIRLFRDLIRAIRVPLRQVSKGHFRPLVTAKLAWNQARSRAVRAVPKLTVRVRFPLPAPHAKSVGAVGIRERHSSAICLSRPTLGHTLNFSWTLSLIAAPLGRQRPSWSFPRFDTSPSAGPSPIPL
jgi:hypothetical protein